MPLVGVLLRPALLGPMAKGAAQNKVLDVVSHCRVRRFAGWSGTSATHCSSEIRGLVYSLKVFNGVELVQLK